jgi:hypothetical protein
VVPKRENTGKTLTDPYFVIFEVLSGLSLKFSLLEYDAL